ncbi:MAG: hypothetical protein QM755_01200 [Luteolibacter sp.]
MIRPLLLAAACLAAVSATNAEPASTKEATAGGLEARLEAVVVPSVNFEDTTVEEAFEYYRQRSLELGCKEVGRLDLGGPDGPVANRRIRLFHLRNVPFPTVLRYTAAAVGASITYSGQTITLRPGVTADTRSEERKKADAVLAKVREDSLNRIILPSVHLDDFSLAEAITFISQRITPLGVQLDSGEPNTLPNILLLDPEGKLADKRITNLHLTKVSAKEALDAIAKACGATARCEPHATVVEPQ